MILHQYLAATARTDEREVRRAMAVALALEIPHDRTGYERFYRRVLDELERAARAVSTAPTPLPAAVSRRLPSRPSTDPHRIRERPEADTLSL